MIYLYNVGDFKDPLKQALALEFCRNQNKDFSILRSKWLGPIFFSPGDIHTKGLLILLHPGPEGVTEVDTDQKRMFMSFKFTPSNVRVLCIFASSRHNTREQFAKGHFFEELQNYMENKSKGNENKIILGDSNCNMQEMDRDGGNKTQRLYKCGSNYTL